ncbi:MAG: hypothetical protein KatS3mg035_0145 [Bacteroidia bacterium]|nr:MAG: hypothetical protein KatS3mg035_0145 [Bacteroidia bacterium]
MNKKIWAIFIAHNKIQYFKLYFLEIFSISFLAAAL